MKTVLAERKQYLEVFEYASDIFDYHLAHSGADPDLFECATDALDELLFNCNRILEASDSPAAGADACPSRSQTRNKNEPCLQGETKMPLHPHRYTPCLRLQKVLNTLGAEGLDSIDQRTAAIICRALHEFAALDPALQPGSPEPLTCQLCHDVAERNNERA